MRFIIISLLLAQSGCKAYIIKTEYENTDLKIIRATSVETDIKCHGRHACYYPTQNEIWIPFTHPEYIIHEMCHYFCYQGSDIKACNIRCDVDYWEKH
jgi:hypothetical protein